jgi:hypothetical protein
MEGSPIDIIIFAPLAPILGVLLFWFLQLVFIESEKYLLEKLKSKHEPLCRFTNFLGILFQTICHALGFTVTKSGISDFYISIDYGKVAPKKEKKGIFEWIANIFLFIGPFFIPALLILLCLLFLMNDGLNIIVPAQMIDLKYTFAGQINIFGASLFSFFSNFLGFLLNIDLLHPGHLGFIILLIFLGMGIRPSYIGEKKKEKVDIFYDLKNIWGLISQRPLYLLLLFLFGYILFYISLVFNHLWYTTLFSIFGWLSIISIVSILIANIILFLIKTTDDLPGFYRFIPFIVLPISYILIRIFFFYIKTDFTYFASIVFMITITFVITILLLKFKTNKFKTNIKMKLLRGKNETEKNGRRSSRKRDN